jgi:hypothetical protein
MPRLRMFIGVVLIASGTAACYATVPLGNAPPPVGSDVVLRLNDTGTNQLASLVGPGVVTVNGRLISAPQDSLVLAVTSTTRRDGEEVFWKKERLAAPQQFIALVEQKQISTVRSVIVGAALAGAAFALRSIAMGGTSGPPSNKPPNGQ